MSLWRLVGGVGVVKGAGAGVIFVRFFFFWLPLEAFYAVYCHSEYLPNLCSVREGIIGS